MLEEAERRLEPDALLAYAATQTEPSRGYRADSLSWRSGSRRGRSRSASSRPACTTWSTSRSVANRIGVALIVVGLLVASALMARVNHGVALGGLPPRERDRPLHDLEDHPDARRAVARSPGQPSRSAPTRSTTTCGTRACGLRRRHMRTISAQSSGWIISSRRDAGPLGHRRVDEAGADRDRSHAVGVDLRVQRPRQRDHRRLRRRVDRQLRHRHRAGDRGEIDDPATRLAQEGDRRLRDEKRPRRLTPICRSRCFCRQLLDARRRCRCRPS